MISATISCKRSSHSVGRSACSASQANVAIASVLRSRYKPTYVGENRAKLTSRQIPRSWRPQSIVDSEGLSERP